MECIIYTSTATPGLSKEELDDILKTSPSNNKRNNITGLLLYAEGGFMQILEGNTADLDHLLNSIKSDRRHKNMMIFYRSQITQRIFKKWSMACQRLDHPDLNDNLIHLNQNPLQELRGVSLRPAVRALVNSFIKTHAPHLDYSISA